MMSIICSVIIHFCIATYSAYDHVCKVSNDQKIITGEIIACMSLSLSGHICVDYQTAKSFFCYQNVYTLVCMIHKPFPYLQVV